MQERISAMMDDQASAQEVDALLRELAQDQALWLQWEAYQLTGDVLRGHGRGDIRNRVSALLAHEPTYGLLHGSKDASVRTRLHGRGVGRSAMSLAASVAAIALVGGLALHLGVLLPTEAPGELARQDRGIDMQSGTSSKGVSMSTALSAEPPQTSAMQEHRLAHEQISSAPMMSSIAGYARLVVNEGGAR